MHPRVISYTTKGTNDIVFFPEDNTYIADAKDIDWGETVNTFPPTVFIMIDKVRHKLDFVKTVKGKDGNIKYCEYRGPDKNLNSGFLYIELIVNAS